MRRTVYRVSFAAVLAMIVASIVSAFLGARVSAAWFASGTMTAIWALLIVVMAVGCAMSLHRRRGGGVLALHLGCLCVLVGGMMGSQRGGAVLNRLTGEDRLQEGSAALRAGERCDVASHDKVEYPLGFELRCERLYRTYYPPRGEGWSFYAARDGRAGGPEVRTPIRLEVDAELILPDGQTQLAVLDVIRPERYDAGPALLISTVHKTRVVAVDEGLSIPLNEPAGTVTIHEIDGESARVTLALEGREPVTERVGTTADVVRRRQLLGPGVLLALLPTKDGRPWREYPAPLVSVLLRRGERLGVQWLAPTSDAAQYELPLAGLFASPTEWREDGAPRLCLQRRQAIRDDCCELVATRDGREIARQVVEANRPMHVGGLHIYLNALIEPDNRPVAVLELVSDRGLSTSYVGFGLIGGAMAWCMWVSPVLRRRKGAA